jgi:hypothetical protein
MLASASMLRAPPCTRLDALLDAPTCARLCAVVDAALDRARAGGADRADWSPSSSSLRWPALPALEAPALAALERRIRTRAALGPAFALDLLHAWWRRQYAPHLAPESHRPHGWHQDGALGYDFVANPGGSSDASSLLPLTTCWIALTPCGVDAPGLELIGVPCVELLGLHALDDAALRERFAPTAFERPSLAAGDALLFGGAVPHRTHVASSMRHTRTSLELRFFGRPLSRRACARRAAP